MKHFKRFLLGLLALGFVGCAGVQPVVVPSVDTVRIIHTDTVRTAYPVYDTLEVTHHDTIIVVVTDTVTEVKLQPVLSLITDTLYEAIPEDTIINAIHLMPVSGDNSPQIQAVVNYCILHGIPEIDLSVGWYKIYSPILLLSFQNGRFEDFSLTIKGANWAKNPVSGMVSEIDPQFRNAPCFAIQQGKDVQILNLMGSGLYDFPDTLTQLQIDTLPFEDWNDPLCAMGPTNPYAFIVFDPFSDSTEFTGQYQMYPGLHQYYVNTGGSGSTSCKVEGCYVENFPVGVLITGGDNYNGEEIDVNDNQFDYDWVPYAYSQAQSKANQFNNNMIWGQCRNLIDGNHFGFRRGDGSTPPFIDVLNIAGYNCQLLYINTQSFSFNGQYIYGEGLFKLGTTQSQYDRGAGATFIGCQIDFQDYAPTPDFWYHGGGTSFIGCTLRYYNGGIAPNRFVINDVGDMIIGGSMSAPPIVVFGSGFTPETQMINAGMFYSGPLGQTVNYNTYDSIVSFTNGFPITVRINRSDFTGYFTTNLAQYVDSGALLMIQGYDQYDALSHYAYPYPGPVNYVQKFGDVTGKNGDTVFYKNGQMMVQDSTSQVIFIAYIK